MASVKRNKTSGRLAVAAGIVVAGLGIWTVVPKTVLPAKSEANVVEAAVQQPANDSSFGQNDTFLNPTNIIPQFSSNNSTSSGTTFQPVQRPRLRSRGS